MENNELAIANPAATNKSYCSVKAETRAEKIKLFNALKECDFKLNDVVGTTIAVKDVFFQEYEKEDKESGEVRLGHRTILFAEDGKTYVTSSNYLYNTLRQILSVFGTPNTWSEPLKVEVAKQTLKDSKSSLTLKLVEE